MGDTGIRRSIVAELSAQYPGLYHDGNVALIGTHSHAGVGGYLENLLPQVTALGYVNETARAIVEGTVRAVQRAHESLAPGSLSVGTERIMDGNINRSPSAYLRNPAEERAMYEFDQDKDMTLVKFTGADGDARAFMSFYAVHGTSLYGNNTLVSGDNKGMAAFLYESKYRVMLLHLSRVAHVVVKTWLSRTQCLVIRRFSLDSCNVSFERKSVILLQWVED